MGTCPRVKSASSFSKAWLRKSKACDRKIKACDRKIKACD